MPPHKQAAMLKPDVPVPPPKASGTSQSLDSAVQAKAENSLHADFSGVRVHHGDGVAESYQAKAVTMGSDIHVAAQASPTDVELMGHELAHVIQQGSAGPSVQAKQTKKDTAQADSDTAQTKKDTAQADSDTAQTKRNTAQADSDTAQTKKNTAQTKKNTAQTKKDTAQAKKETVQAKRDTAQAKGDRVQAKEEGAKHTGAVQAKDSGGPPARRHEVEADKAGAAVAQGQEYAVETSVTSAGVSPQAYDWHSFFSGVESNVARAVLEVGRLVPGYGMYAGAVADGIEMGQYLETLRKVQGAGPIEALIIARTLVNGLNNIIGHVQYVDQLVQDGITVAVVTVEFTPLTAGISEVLDIVQSVLSGVTIGIDISVALEAQKLAANFPTESAEYADLMNIRNNFICNAVADTIGALVNIFDLCTGGFSNAETLRTFFLGAKGGAKAAKEFAKAADAFILQNLTIWFGGLGASSEGREYTGPISRKAVQTADEPASPTEVVLPEGAAQVGEELSIVQEVYGIGQTIVDGISGTIDAAREGIQSMIMEVTEGEEPFTWLKNKLAEGVQQFSEELAGFARFQELIQQAKEANEGAKEGMDSAKNTILGLTLPNIPDPQPSDYGDSWLANAAEWVSDTAQNAAASTMQWVRDQLQQAIDFAKTTIIAALDEVLGMVDSVLEWLEDYGAMLDEMIAEASAKVEEFSQAIAQAEGFGDIFGVLIDAITEAISPHEEEIDFEGLSALWSQLGSTLADAFSQLSGYGQ
ncbi:MAG: DUF4157 domain-containing protein [Bradymonadales bacterium]|nr:DUF4157 domain-containing protein [Bradymonadales bacterium]